MSTYILNDPTKVWSVTANTLTTPLNNSNLVVTAPGLGYVSFPDAYIVIGGKKIFIQSTDPAADPIISLTLNPGDIWFDLP
jgi:hypothetical protein